MVARKPIFYVNDEADGTSKVVFAKSIFETKA
jgi:hypothetical protein